MNDLLSIWQKLGECGDGLGSVSVGFSDKLVATGGDPDRTHGEPCEKRRKAQYFLTFRGAGTASGREGSTPFENFDVYLTRAMARPSFWPAASEAWSKHAHDLCA
jgi:hypothetical protein